MMKNNLSKSMLTVLSVVSCINVCSMEHETSEKIPEQISTFEHAAQTAYCEYIKHLVPAAEMIARKALEQLNMGIDRKTVANDISKAAFELGIDAKHSGPDVYYDLRQNLMVLDEDFSEKFPSTSQPEKQLFVASLHMLEVVNFYFNRIVYDLLQDGTIRMIYPHEETEAERVARAKDMLNRLANRVYLKEENSDDKKITSFFFEKSGL